MARCGHSTVDVGPEVPTVSDGPELREGLDAIDRRLVGSSTSDDVVDGAVTEDGTFHYCARA